jgi:predicted NBD/HSP70 family sugar kinase
MVESATSAGHLLGLVRSGAAYTRRDLQAATGLSRSTLVQRVDALLQTGYLRPGALGRSEGGRPPTRLEFNREHRYVLAGDLGATHGRLAVQDLAGRPLAQQVFDVDISAGPRPVLDIIVARFGELLAEANLNAQQVCGIGLGIPGPVEFTSGRVVQPPIMPGWHDYPISQHLHAAFGTPVLVDNDANLMALGEQAIHYPDCPSLVLVKASTGIGAGFIVGGQPYRGVDGGAGDIGHIRIHGHDNARCRCGSLGCLAAVASGGALAERLQQPGQPALTSRDVLARATSGDAAAVAMTRDAGLLVGEVVATVVCLLNPAILVIAGDLSETPFLTGIQETLYQRALPRATRHLKIVTSKLGDRAGVTGAGRMVVDTRYSPDAVDAELASLLNGQDRGGPG